MNYGVLRETNGPISSPPWSLPKKREMKQKEYQAIA